MMLRRAATRPSLTPIPRSLISPQGWVGERPASKDGRMNDRTFVVVGSLTRDAPYFQGARGKGITVFAFDEQTRPVD